MNGCPEDTKIFRRHFRDTIRDFHPKAQVWKAKLKTCLEPAKLGFIMYSAHTLQVSLIIKKFLKLIEQENGHSKEIKIQLNVSLQTNEYCKMFEKR